ncbi:MAG: Smr/MutS family protein [Chitinophagaceae bacterium]|nr:Smr/MutS family protein [Chitinophagaceae bacterium]
MKYQIGDKVILLHTGEEATVTEIINEKMLVVDVGDVSFPVFADQVDFPYYRLFTEKKTASNRKIKRYAEDLKKDPFPQMMTDTNGMFFCLLPVFEEPEKEEELIREFKLYLVNSTPQEYNFTYCFWLSSCKEFELLNTIHPNQQFYLHNIAMEQFNDNPVFHFNFRCKVPQPDKAPNHEQKLRIKPKDLFKKIDELNQNSHAVIRYTLFEHFPLKKKEEDPFTLDYEPVPDNMYEAGRTGNVGESPRFVLDLHIEKLTDQWKNMKPAEMLHLQMQEFEKHYASSVAHQLPYLFVVHGVGEGVLREKIHAFLKEQKEVKEFANRYHPSFGYGATEIFFQY